MSIRKPVADVSAAELARRRLTLLGAELSPALQGPTPGAAEGPPALGDHVGPAGPQAGEPAGSDAVVVDVARPGAGRHARARLSWGSRVLGSCVDALPPTLHGRLRITAQHVTVVALTLAAAMAVAAWLLVRSAPEPSPRRASLALPAGPAAAVRPSVQPTAAPSTAAPADVGPASGAVSSASAAPARLVVHVAGRVRRPGVVALPAGSRVIDAVQAAGGARRGTRLGSVNLARLVVDGEQIAVGVPTAATAPAAGVPGVPPAPTGTASTATPVNLNSASQAELEELPGVGPVTATSIIEWRSKHGGFGSVDELIEVSGIGEVTLAELRDLVTV